MNRFVCHICGSEKLIMEASYSLLSRVTSDCKPWPKGGELAVCQKCGFAQAVVTPHWHEEASQIYKSYSIYHQSGGREQSIFDAKSGKPVARSAHLIEKLLEHVQIPKKGLLLDLGCGNGQLLKNASASLPDWELAGSEFDEKHQNEVLKIRGVKHFHSCEAEDIPGKFDLITLVHVLEHIPDPKNLLMQIWGKLKVGGLLVIDVPNYILNPFILLIADHCTHFSTKSVVELTESAGYEILVSTENWIPKETVLVLRKNGDEQSSRPFRFCSENLEAIPKTIHWLDQLRDSAKSASQNQPFGVFGTSIGATFLMGELGDRISYFVDEDPNRIGKKHLGLPIYQPGTDSARGHLFIPLPPVVIHEVVDRLNQGTNVVLHWSKQLVQSE